MLYLSSLVASRHMGEDEDSERALRLASHQIALHRFQRRIVSTSLVTESRQQAARSSRRAPKLLVNTSVREAICQSGAPLLPPPQALRSRTVLTLILTLRALSRQSSLTSTGHSHALGTRYLTKALLGTLPLSLLCEHPNPTNPELVANELRVVSVRLQTYDCSTSTNTV